MNKNEYTTLTEGRIKVLIAHDGNYNNLAIDRCQALEILDDDGNVIKTLAVSNATLSFDVEVTEENKELCDYLYQIAYNKTANK